jgi:hypothetical protein
MAFGCLVSRGGGGIGTEGLQMRRIWTLVVASVLMAGGGVAAGTAWAANTVTFQYTASGWTSSHSGCFTDRDFEFPPNDEIEVVNPTSAAVSTGDSVSASFTFDPPLHVHSADVTGLTAEIRLTAPAYDSFGGYPAPAATLTFTGTNVASSVASTFAGSDNYQGSSLYTPLIAYGISGDASTLIPDPTKDAEIDSMSVSFTAPDGGSGSGNPDFANTTFVARADLFAQGVCPDPGPVFSSTPSDNTAPSASPSVSPAANTAGWNNSDTTVNWNWADNTGGSGIDAANCTASAPSSGEGTQTLNATCKDLAGNEGQASYTVHVDKTAPSASPSVSPAANAAGWNNTNVTVNWNWADSTGGSGIDASNCTASTPSSGEGTQALNASCNDVAGNQAGSNSTVRVDTTKPTLTVATGGLANGGTYPFGSLPAQPSCTVNDNGSGPAQSACTVAGYSTALGQHTITFSGADVAGNSATTSWTYTVAGDTFGGFQAPLPKTKLASSASTIPVKFTVLNYLGKTAVTTASTRVIITSSATNLTTPLGSVSCAYSASLAAYQCNLKTPAGVSKSATYYLALQENLGGTWMTLPNAPRVTNTNIEPIGFK